MGLRGWVNRQANKAKKKAEDAGKKIEHEAKKAGDKIKDTAEDAGDAIKKTAEQAKRDAEALAREAGREVQEQIMSVIDDVRNIANRAKREVTDLANKAKREVTEVANKAKSGVEEVANKAKKEVTDEVNKVGEKVEEALTEKLPDLLEEVFVEKLPDFITKQAPKLAEKIVKEIADETLEFAGELQKALSGPGLRMTKKIIQTTHKELTRLTEEEPELVEDLDSIGGGLRVGLIKAQFSGFYTRMDTLVEVLDRYIADPPEFRRREIREFLTALGPTSLQFVGSAKANIVCVGSSVMEIEVDVDGIPFRLGIKAVDEILKQAGVPE